MPEALEDKSTPSPEESPQGMGQFRQSFSEMPMGRRLALAGALALVVGGLVALLLWVNRPSYQVLYGQLEQRDAAQVVAKLKELKVPYHLSDNGRTIKVPAERLYETRLALASEGLPRGGGIGFEIFNEVKIGSTDFVQKINYQRALQGELARTIASFSEVDQARVHIVMPKESLFIEDQKKPSASVVLRLRSGRRLKKRQIQGIVYLVASAVPGLTPEGVTVVDSDGNLLYRKEADTADFPAAQTASQLEYQRSVENMLKAKAQSMLESILGPGRAVVRVSADIDFTRTSVSEQVYDPDKVAVRSETRSSEENQNAGPLPVGTPDQRYNLATRNATPTAAGAKGGSKSKRENETTNFEITSTRRQSVRAIGGLKRLSVAVVVDGPYKETKGPDGKLTRTFTPRSKEEMRQLADIVRRAVGYDKKRGDQISLVNVPFALPKDLGTAAGKDWQDYLHEYGPMAINLVVAVLFFLMVVRPVLRHFMARAKPAEVAVTAGAPQAVGPGEELPGEEMAPDLLESITPTRKVGTKDMILALAQQDPERTTSVLRAWIHEGE